MKKSLFLSAIVLIVFASFALGENKSWKKEPKDFRGIPFGASESVAIKRIPSLDCTDTEELRRSCSDRAVFRIGKVEMEDHIYFLGDKMNSVLLQFNSKEFDYIKSVFIEKYGPPTDTDNETVRTKLGVVYKNQTLWWIGKNIVISLIRYLSNTEESVISYGLITDFNQGGKDYEKTKKEAVKDF